LLCSFLFIQPSNMHVDWFGNGSMRVKRRI